MLSALLRWIRSGLARRFDRKYCVDTCGDVHQLNFAPDARQSLQEANYYAPAGFARVRRAIRFSGVDPSRFHFVDLGCGKGRVLLLADRAGFATVTGIEADGALCAIAESNAREWRRSFPSSRIAVDHADARSARLPDGNLFVFMANPFTGEVLEDVAKRLAALDENGQKVVIAYIGDEHAEVFARTGTFVRTRIPTLRPWLKSSMSILRGRCANASH